MKVSYQGKVKKISQFPKDMTELRRVVQRKFANRSMRSPDQSDSRQLSDAFDHSAASGDNRPVQEFFDNQVANRSSASMRAGRPEKHVIQWDQEIMFYEDSEGDFNVISEDEDVTDAATYTTQRNKKALECTILKRTMYDQMRQEQMGNDLNQSTTWMKSDQNLFNSENKDNRKKQKDIQRQTGDLPAGMDQVLNKMVKNEVENQLQMQRESAQRQSEANLKSQERINEIQNNDDDFEFDKAYNAQDLANMAKVISSDEVILDVFEGQIATLEFTIENQSSIVWPFKPYLQNEKDHSQRQLVDKLLHPGQQSVISFEFQVPKGKKIYTIRLQLVDPQKFEKINDQILIGFCQIKPNDIPSFNSMDMQQIQEKARPFRNTIQNSEMCDDIIRLSQDSRSLLSDRQEESKISFDPLAKVDMIDRVLNEHCNYDTEQSELGLDVDPSEDLEALLLDNMDGSSSARNTAEHNNQVLADTKALLAQMKLSLNQGNIEEADGQNSVQQQKRKIDQLFAETDQIRAQSPRITKKEDEN